MADVASGGDAAGVADGEVNRFTFEVRDGDLLGCVGGGANGGNFVEIFRGGIEEKEKCFVGTRTGANGRYLAGELGLVEEPGAGGRAVADDFVAELAGDFGVGGLELIAVDF